MARSWYGPICYIIGQIIKGLWLPEKKVKIHSWLTEVWDTTNRYKFSRSSLAMTNITLIQTDLIFIMFCYWNFVHSLILLPFRLRWEASPLLGQMSGTSRTHVLRLLRWWVGHLSQQDSNAHLQQSSHREVWWPPRPAQAAETCRGGRGKGGRIADTLEHCFLTRSEGGSPGAGEVDGVVEGVGEVWGR